jgi:hypothetical protein
VGLATERNAQQAGDLADGLVDAAAGVLGADRERRNRGARNAAGVVREAVTQIATGAAITAGVAADAAAGMVRGDRQRVVDGAKQLGAIVAVSALAVGVADGVFPGLGLVDEADIASGRAGAEGDAELHPELREIDER